MTSLSAVEVRRDPETHAWYNAYLEDATDAGIVCSFEDGTWPEETFPASDVRFQTPQRSRTELDAFEPALGDLVDMELPRTASAPSGWRRCRVKGRQRALFFVAPTERLERGARGEVLVPQAKLRPAVLSRASVQGLLAKVKIPLDPHLSRWLAKPEAAASFARVKNMCGGNERQADARPYLLQLKPALSGEPAVFLIGTASAIRHAKSWTTMVINYALWIEKCEEATKRRDQALEDRQRRVRSAAGSFEFFKEFEADVDYVFGPALDRHHLQDLYGVRIEVVPGSSERKRIVRIFGDEEIKVQEVLDNIEQVEETLDVDQKMNSWVVGRGGSTIIDIQRSAGLWACKLDNKSQKLIFHGSRSACNRAKELYRAHMLYYDTFLAMDERLDELTAHFQEHRELQQLLSGDILKGRWKGSGKHKSTGKGKGDFEKGKGKNFGDVDRGKGKGKGKGKMMGKSLDPSWDDTERDRKGKGRGNDSNRAIASDEALVDQEEGFYFDQQ